MGWLFAEDNGLGDDGGDELECREFLLVVFEKFVDAVVVKVDKEDFFESADLSQHGSDLFVIAVAGEAIEFFDSGFDGDGVVVNLNGFFSTETNQFAAGAVG